MCIDYPAQDAGEAAGQCYGIGRSTNTITASLLEIVAAANRRWRSAGQPLAYACGPDDSLVDNNDLLNLVLRDRVIGLPLPQVLH